MAHAESLCRARGERLTPIRRQVLEALAAQHRPFGAYDLIDQLSRHKKRLAPITIYRALDFLVENGLVHRIESRNAYLACINNHDAREIVVFLICERCGSVGETPSTSVAASLGAAAKAAGFAPRAPLIEIAGLCAHCRDA
jgi:Fur family zinc uptake transcriptional regulator